MEQNTNMNNNNQQVQAQANPMGMNTGMPNTGALNFGNMSYSNPMMGMGGMNTYMNPMGVQQPLYSQYNNMGMQYGQMAFPGLNVPNYLNAQEIAQLQTKTNHMQLGLTQEDVLEGVCNHRFPNGLPAWIDNGDGSSTCRICNYRYMNISPTVQQVQETTDRMIDYLQIMKMMFIDMSPEAARSFYQIIPMLKKVPKLFEVAANNFQKYENLSLGISNVGYGNPFASMDAIIRGGNPMMGMGTMGMGGNPMMPGMGYQNPMGMGFGQYMNPPQTGGYVNPNIYGQTFPQYQVDPMTGMPLTIDPMTGMPINPAISSMNASMAQQGGFVQMPAMNQNNPNMGGAMPVYGGIPGNTAMNPFGSYMTTPPMNPNQPSPSVFPNGAGMPQQSQGTIVTNAQVSGTSPSGKTIGGADIKLATPFKP